MSESDAFQLCVGEWGEGSIVQICASYGDTERSSINRRESDEFMLLRVSTRI